MVGGCWRGWFDSPRTTDGNGACRSSIGLTTVPGVRLIWGGNVGGPEIANRDPLTLGLGERSSSFRRTTPLRPPVDSSAILDHSPVGPGSLTELDYPSNRSLLA